jgi:predicted nucleic acid-binding protein
MHDEQAATGGPVDRRVEAARYALLRRLAFAMRHHMVVHLQPIGMITEVLERRLGMPSPDLAEIHDNMDKINGLSRAAVLPVTVRPNQDSAGFPGDPPYRLLAWDEVRALAHAEGVGLEQDGLTARLTLPAAGG